MQNPLSLALIAVGFLLSACGGGGSSDSSAPVTTPPPPPPPVNEAPVANAGDDLSVGELAIVSLSGSASDPDDTTESLSVSWTQTGGVSVTLDASDSLTPGFTAPEVTSPTVLTFELTVTDPDGLSDTDSVDVTVAVNQEVGGLWVGQDAAGDLVYVLSTDDGRFHWLIPSTEEQGFGTVASSGSTLTASYTHVAPIGFTLLWDGSTSADCTATGTIQERQSMSVTTSCTTTNGSTLNNSGTLTYDSLYDNGASLETISGNYDESGYTLNIDQNGVVSEQNPDNGCTVSGQVNVIDPTQNVYEGSITYSNCTGADAIRNGATFSGIGLLDNSQSPEQIVFGATGTINGVGHSVIWFIPRILNAAPVANAGGDTIYWVETDGVVSLDTVVAFAGAASDTDDEIGTLSVSWTQTGGVPVTLDESGSLNPSFTAPDITGPEVLTFELTVTDPDGLSSTDSVELTLWPDTVTISGTLQYEFPPPNNDCNGLNYSAIESRPIRQATVQLLDQAMMNVLDSTVSDDLGQYSFTVDAETDWVVRVRAELIRAGNSSWDVQVRNNVDTDDPPAPLDERPIYVMDSSVIDSGVANQALNLTATTGWGGSSYTEARVSGPFAILDVIYDAMTLVGDVDPNVNFGSLDAFWSPDNSLANGDIEDGDLGTSFYNGQRQLFLVGLDGEDTDEFDDHIVAHEWTHYFEDNLSRSDSIGGSHGGGDSLDMRVAFGEGFAQAMSAIILDDPVYCDTNSANNDSGWAVNMEQDSSYREGWFNEDSVQEVVYDLWDTNSDGDDDNSVGFEPIYDVMSGPQKATPAFTSIFSFATYLKAEGTGKNAFINALLSGEDITNDTDIWGSMETNAGALAGVSADVLPVYTDLTLGSTINICVNSGYDGYGDGNKLADNRYLKLDLASNTAVTFEMTANPVPTDDAGEEFVVETGDPLGSGPDNPLGSDPDIYVFQNGEYVTWGESGAADTETINSSSYSAGVYVLEILDWRMMDPDIPAEYPERVCFDFTAN